MSFQTFSIRRELLIANCCLLCLNCLSAHEARVEKKKFILVLHALGYYLEEFHEGGSKMLVRSFEPKIL